nr:hypothetical protein [Tanacetum cinerariifolium]
MIRDMPSSVGKALSPQHKGPRFDSSEALGCADLAWDPHATWHHSRGDTWHCYKYLAGLGAAGGSGFAHALDVGSEEAQRLAWVPEPTFIHSRSHVTIDDLWIWYLICWHTRYEIQGRIGQSWV